MRRTFTIAVVMLAAFGGLVAQQEKLAPRKLDGMNLMKACGGPQGGGMAAKWGTPIPAEGNIDYGYCLG